MPRNGSGTYSLPSGNPVVTGTPISSTVHNNTMTDIATAMTGSLPVNGEKAMTGTMTFVKGADVASAGALPVDIDGNMFDVTGTTTITSLNTKRAGTYVVLQFDGALTLTHHATDLILPGGANITTAAGDIATLYEYATGDWRCISYQRALYPPGPRVVQAVEATPYTTYASITATIPVDDTIPQNTEGTEVITATITPKATTNRLVIEAILQCSVSPPGTIVGALFQDSTAGALAANFMNLANTLSDQFVMRHEMAAGTTSATTFKIRAGISSGGTLYLNGGGSGRLFGGVTACRLRITEIA